MLLLLAIATSIAPVAAQDNTTDNSTVLNDTEDLRPGDLGDDAVLDVDDNAYVESWSHEDGRHRVTVGATDSDTTVLLLPVIDTDDDSASSTSGTSVDVDAGDTRTRTIDTEDTIVVATIGSLGDVEYVVLDPSNDVLIGGPWTANDSRLSATGAGLAVMTMVAIKELRRRLGVGLQPEWVR